MKIGHNVHIYLRREKNVLNKALGNLCNKSNIYYD